MLVGVKRIELGLARNPTGVIHVGRVLANVKIWKDICGLILARNLSSVSSVGRVSENVNIC